MNSFRNGLSFVCSHPTASNLLMLLFVLLGLMALPDLKRETFPDFSVDAVQISAVYPGATAQDVEISVCQRIEDAIDGVENIYEVRSTAMESRGTVVVEMVEGRDMITFVNDLKTEVEAISDFPDEVEDVIVKRMNRTDAVVSIAVTGPMTDRDLKFYCEQLKDRLKRDAGLSQVQILGFSDHELRIEIPRYRMMQLALSVSDIETAVASQSLDLPAGSLETREADILIRFEEERRSVADLESLVVVSGQTGAEIRLGEIARITDRFMDEENQILFNGSRAGLLQISKSKSEDALRVMDAVQAFLDRERLKAPPGVSFAITQNASDVVRDRLSMLVENGLQGLILVFLAMLAFFPFVFSFWVAMGLPISFMLTFFFMKYMGLSLNMLSMVGLLIGLGLIMDDAIVIAENIAAHLEKGKNGFNATVDGISEVAAGVFSSFLTTLFIFGALVFGMAGDIGKVLYAIPVVLILTLSISLVEAFLILPNHLAHSLKGRDGNGSQSRIREKIEAGLDVCRTKILGRLVDWAVDFRYLFIGLVVLSLLTALGLMAGGVLKVKAFPDVEGDQVQARLLFPQGTPLAQTRKAAEQLTTAARQMDRQLSPSQPGGGPLVENISVLYNTNADAGETGPHVVTVSLDLLKAEARTGTMDDIVSAWRKGCGDIPDSLALSFKEPSLGPAGLPIEIRLSGEDLHQLKQASGRLIDWLYGYEGVEDLYDDLRPGKPELKVSLRQGAKARGFDARKVAGQLRAAFYGATASEIIVRDQSYEVNVRMASEDRSRISDLENFHLIDSQGSRVPLKAVARISYSRGYAGIRRVDGVRTVTVTGDVDSRIANAANIIADTRNKLVPELTRAFPDISISLQGQEKEMATSMEGMVSALGIGIFGIFCLLSLQFRSYQEPLIIMAAIPFAFVGVVFGHLIMGLDISLPSILGFVSLAGIVVNDSILLVSFIRMHAGEGHGVAQAGKNAARDRFRAVMLTSVTTIAGLLPLLSERSMQAQVLIPLACSIVFGLLMSTILVLVVVPCFYAIMDDFGLVKMAIKKEPGSLK